MIDQIGSTSVEGPSRSSAALAMVDEWALEVHDGLVRKSLIVDDLLDLRAELADEPLLLIEVDQFLSSIPGKTVVEPKWWAATLATLRSELSQRLPAGAVVDS
ncbi:unannotated protein [freshwater metagenome]|uniref:Unannotated protein n=1 Tax=freshwater metagenome TaxID=449393 RepID=A0A6J6BGS5_9ZZZZ|nr:hypothetical protein [Actinomycetota bacterium]MSY79943.1 hypothetical protein [Actinomycetota bacterium]MTA63552.1 hypothetical protein [Actinomycetota bacterium]